METVVRQVQEHAKTLTPETFQRWVNDLRFKILEEGSGFIVDGEFMFAPEFISTLYNQARVSGSLETRFSLSGIYDMHI